MERGFELKSKAEKASATPSAPTTVSSTSKMEANPVLCGASCAGTLAGVGCGACTLQSFIAFGQCHCHSAIRTCGGLAKNSNIDTRF